MENNQTQTKRSASEISIKGSFSISKEIQHANIGKQIKDCSDEEIKQVLRYIFILLGTKSDLIPDGLAKDVLLNFIKERLWLLTTDELRLSFVYAVEKRTEVELTLFGETFSAKTVLEVVEGYNKYKRQVLAREKKQVVVEEKKTPEEIDYILTDACVRAFDDYRADIFIRDAGNVKYNFLVKKGILNFTKERKDSIYEATKIKMRQRAVDEKLRHETIETALKKLLPENIIFESRRVALLEFFKDLTETETELKDLIDLL